MKSLFRLLLVLASASFFYASAQAQNAGTVSNHAVPIGKGPGVTGFSSVAPGTTGVPFVSNGASSDPSYQVLGFGGGGTGQTTRATALNALMPTPTRAGDVVYWNGTQFVSLAGNNSGTLCLSENSSGTPSWITCGGLVVGSSVISGGTTGRPLYDNGGVLGEYAQVPTGFGGTGADNSTNTIADLLSSNGTNGQFVKTSMLSMCIRNPGACTQAFGYTSIMWYGAVCNGSTDDTAAIQTAINSIGYPGGGLFIPATASGGPNSGRSSAGGCVIRLPGSPVSPNCALVINKPIHLFGQGHGSLLNTEATMATTTDNVCIFASDANWETAKFEAFSIALDGEYHPAAVTDTYRRYGKRGLAFRVTSNPTGFQNLIVENVQIGESFNDVAVYFEGLATQGSTVINSSIYGGLAFSQVADNNKILFNRFLGSSNGTFGFSLDAPGAGKTIIQGNTFAWPGGNVFTSGSFTMVADNYFEQGANASPSGTIIDVAAGIQTTFRGNTIQSFTNGVVPLRIQAAATNTMLDGNYIATNGATTQGVNNFSASTVCQGLNIWSTTAARVNNAGAGALKNAVGTTVTDCP